MSRFFILRLVFFSLSFTMFSCSSNWTEAIRKGEIVDSTFQSSVEIEVKTGLIIIPVTIKGQVYRFIFDSGAPTSISQKLQDEFNFKTLTKSTIRDSEGNRSKVIYVEIDSLFINDLAFIEQTAFVGNFESNPVLKCIGVDGIIGSNLMRLCNWTIDSENRKISFFNHPVKLDTLNAFQAPFTTNSQFDLLVELKIGKAKVKNIKIDYGSNGDLSLPPSAFSKIDDAEVFKTKFDVIGYSQTGLMGKVNERKYKITYADSLLLGNCLFENVKVKSKGSGLLGNHLLSEYTVTIDWQNKLLHFEENENTQRSNASFGLGFGNDTEAGALYIQSIVVGSEAYNRGLRPSMKVRKLDSLDFTKNNSYCDFVEWMNYNTGALHFEYKNEDSKWQTITLEKEYLDND